MDVERIDRIDAEGKALLGIFLHLAGRGGKDGYIHVLQFLDVLYYGVIGEFGGLVLGSCTAHNTCTFHVGSGLDGFERILADIAITYDGCTYLLHN